MRKAMSLEYEAKPRAQRTRKWSPWMVATLAGNPLVWMGLTIVITLIAVVLAVLTK